MARYIIDQDGTEWVRWPPDEQVLYRVPRPDDLAAWDEIERNADPIPSLRAFAIGLAVGAACWAALFWLVLG